MKKLCFFVLILIVLTNALFAETYNIKNVLAISIPDTMELQDGLYKELLDSIKGSVFNLTPKDNRIVFQQKGLSDFGSAAYETYARMIITYDYDTELIGIGPFLTSRDISNNEIEYLDKIIRLGIENEMNSISNRLVSYDPTTLLQTKNFSYLKTSYTRVSSNNKPVYVERYMIYNNGCLINISVSSRVAEKETLF